MTDPRTAFAAAVREVNTAFARLPQSAQDAMPIYYDGLDREVDRTMTRGDRDGALAAIRAWRDHWMREIGRAVQE